jgi:hypothetical protein
VLADKGSLRRAKNQRALASSAPFRLEAQTGRAAPAGTQSTSCRQNWFGRPKKYFAELDKHNSKTCFAILG